MSTLNYSNSGGFTKDFGIRVAPTLLDGGVGASWVPDFVATQVDRAYYGALEGGTGRWAFGTMRTPQRAVMDWFMGWDPDVVSKPDPNFNPTQAKALYETMPLATRVAVQQRGGQELVDDIINNSVSANHLDQRMREIEVIVKAQMEIEDYDREAYMMGYATQKVTSALTNYVFSDPTTAISMVATAGLASAATAGAAAARASTFSIARVGLATRVTALSQQYTKTWKTATYLWNGMDGASSAYSAWKQLNDDGYIIYGKTYHQDEDWTDNVAFGALLGLTFTAGADAIGRWSKARDLANKTSELENLVANSAEGTLGTQLDHVAQSAWRSSKSRLETNLDTITGPDTELRRLLMDDDVRKGAGWGSREDMDELSDWIEKNKPDAAELNQHVADRMEAARLNKEKVDSWQGEVEDYVLKGGDERHFFRKKAFDLLRQHMGEDAQRFRFIVDWLEEASGDSRLVAQWLARGDKDRVIRAANAINANSRVGILQDSAITSALERVRIGNMKAAADEAVQAANRLHDNIVQGRWRGAIDILDEMHTEASTRMGKTLAEIDGAINQLNDAFVRLNDEAFEKLDHFKELQIALKEYQDALKKYQRRTVQTRRNLEKTLDPDASTSDVVLESHKVLDEPPWFDGSIDRAMANVVNALDNFKKYEGAVASTLDEVKRTRREILLKGGRDALDRTMTEVSSFPLWKVELSAAGHEAVRRTSIAHTKAANRWKVDFVDYFLGEGAADNALASGSSPMRPVIRARKPMARVSVAEQESILIEEMQRIDPEVARIQAAAKDLSLDSKIAAAREGAEKLRKSVADAKAMRDSGAIRSPEAKSKLDKLISTKERAAKRMENLAERLDNQLNNQVDVLNKDITPDSGITPDTLRAGRVAEKRAAADSSAQKLAKLSEEERYSKKGRALRNKARRAAAEAEGGTKYSSRLSEHRMIEDEISVKRAALKDLVDNKKATSADPRVTQLTDDIAYLEKRGNTVKADIDAIEGRPAMIRRSHELASANPKVEDAMEVSRIRAQIAVAVEAGEAEFAEELNRKLYAMYGDATRLPRWTALEDFFVRRQRAALNGEPTEEILTATMDGRNMKFSVLEAKRADVTVREGVEAAAAELPTKPTMSSGKGRTVATETSKKEAADMRDAQLMERALETDPEAIAARSEPRTTRYENAAVSEASASEAPSKAPPSKAGTKEAPKTKEEAKAEKRDLILSKLMPSTPEGERLVITNAVLNSMGRVPALRALGQALFKLQTAGTKFGSIHTLARSMDLVVASFNMLDKPMPLVKALGFNNGNLRTLQHFRDRGKVAVTRLATEWQRVKNQNQWDELSDFKVQTALDTGDTSALNAGEASIYRILREDYDGVGARLEVTHPGILRPNYRPREGNARAILARAREAQANFRDVYAERIMTSGNPLPDELADAIGVPRGTAFNVLSVADQNAFRARIVQHADEMAAETISRLTNSITQDGIGFRRAGAVSRSSAARTMEDEVANNPALRRWYIGSPIMEHKLYMEVRAPQIHFDAQLSEMLGVSTSFDDVIGALRQQAVSITDFNVRKEMEKAIDMLERKWHFATGRAQYNANEMLDPALRISTGIVRGSAGSLWGMAGLVTELPRAIGAAKMYGGNMLHGMFDALHAMRRANDIGAFEDIAHATDQYVSHAHSSFGSGVGTSISERFIAPWERFWHVATGQEVVTEGTQAMGRVTGSAIALAEAYGETGMRLGLMQYFSGMARCVADRQAKRFLSRNIDRMARLADSLESLGAVSEQTPATIARFKELCDDAGIPYDVALQMNNSGMLTPQRVASLRNGLHGQEEVFSLSALRGRVDDDAMSSVMDYLTAAHNFHVPTASLASSVEAGSAIEKMFYNLTSYSRAFASGVAFQTAANGRLATMATTYASLMVGENIYQAVRDVALGRSTPDKLEQEWNDDPASFFLSRAVKTPWLGAHHSPAISFIESFTGGGGQSIRGNNIFGPIIQSGAQFSRTLFSNEKTGERDFKFFETHTPLINTWYSRLMMGEEN